MSATTKKTAVSELRVIEKQALPYSRKLQAIKIITQADFNQAGELLKELKQRGKLAKDKMDRMLDLHKQLIAETRGIFTPFLSSIPLIEAQVKDQMLKFIESTRKQEQQLEDDFSSGKIKKISTLVSKQTALQIDSSAAQIRKIWKAIPVDVKKTPSEYMIVDEDAIKAAFKAGKKVAGWEWVQIDSIAV